MRPGKIRTGCRKFGNLLYSIILLSMMLFLNGCTGKGDLRFNPPPDGSEFKISGTLKLPEIIETELAASLRADLATIGDFSGFKITAGPVSSSAQKDGSFSISGIPFSQTLVLRAEAGKVVLLRRVTEDELFYSDLSNLELNLQTTAEALIYQQGVVMGKNLTPADIRAREYSDQITSIVTALKLMLQLPKTAVSKTVIDLPAVTSPAKNAATSILEREIILKEANSVLRHVLSRRDLELLKVYISPAFSNDWDSSSTWNDAISHFSELFAGFTFEDVDWRVIDMELLPESRARVRTRVSFKLRNSVSEQIVREKTWIFDAIWRKEGSFWKVFRNMPYRDTHPTQVGADARWGELAEAHHELQAALAVENLSVFASRISNIFGNDFDVTSTRNDLLVTTQSRFNAMDVKIAEYSIDSIEFTGIDRAKVRCRANVRVISLLPGIDVDSGNIEAIVEWRKEDGVWKIFRNLPYRFSHPRKLN